MDFTTINFGFAFASPEWVYQNIVHHIFMSREIVLSLQRTLQGLSSIAIWKQNYPEVYLEDQLDEIRGAWVLNPAGQTFFWECH